MHRAVDAASQRPGLLGEMSTERVEGLVGARARRDIGSATMKAHAATVRRWGSRVLAWLLRLITFVLSRFVRDSDRRIVFCSAFGYGGNCRAIYEAMRQDPHYRCIWISTRRSDSHGPWCLSPRGIWEALRACTWVVDHYLYATLPGTYVSANKLIIQTWHGVGIKTIGKGERKPDISLWRTLDDASRYDLFITTSPLMGKHFAQGLGIAPSRIAITGYPRNDILTQGPAAREKALESLRQRISYHFRHLILYAPTFREGAGQFELPFSSEVEGVLANRLFAYDATLIAKWHPNTERLLGPRLPRWERVFAFSCPSQLVIVVHGAVSRVVP